MGGVTRDPCRNETLKEKEIYPGFPITAIADAIKTFARRVTDRSIRQSWWHRLLPVA
jgi:hypothetical protein